MKAVPVCRYDPRRSSCSVNKYLVDIGILPKLSASCTQAPISNQMVGDLCMVVLVQSLEKSGPKDWDRWWERP
jgi:hypothetical protein